MEDWKRMYSNNDTKTVALPYFWQNFDKENYSLWYCEYQYPEDLKLIFMTCNLVGGEPQTSRPFLISLLGFIFLNGCPV